MAPIMPMVRIRGLGRSSRGLLCGRRYLLWVSFSAVNGPYLKTTLEAIADGHPHFAIDGLRPWNFEPPS